jgi:hypothetical protein
MFVCWQAEAPLFWCHANIASSRLTRARTRLAPRSRVRQLHLRTGKACFDAPALDARAKEVRLCPKASGLQGFTVPSLALAVLPLRAPARRAAARRVAARLVAQRRPRRAGARTQRGCPH